MQTQVANIRLSSSQSKPQSGGMKKSNHTVFGAGQVGLGLARHLAAAGHEVRIVRRSAPGPHLDGVTWRQGDARDPDVAASACAGASVVYNCTNPSSYADWSGLPPLFRSIWDAAAGAGARLVQLDNLYMYGKPEHEPFSERTPERPCRDKGHMRKQLSDELLARHRRGDLVATVGRASDFFGPDAPQTLLTRPDALRAIRKGGTVWTFGDPDLPHGYTFIPDVVKGLAVLGARAEAPGRVWHLPTTWKGTTRGLVDGLAACAGTRATTRRVPTWLLRAVGVVSPLARALADMAYQFEVPYVPDDGAFCHTFGVAPTPVDEALAATVRPSVGAFCLGEAKRLGPAVELAP
ncbi:MAG: NAD-dependent epimerase/dehydratase family protein [Myxococcota bacterium]